LAAGSSIGAQLSRGVSDRRESSKSSGWVFVFHQLGGATAAVAGGWARVQFADYQSPSWPLVG
jgi:hypothetical protein